ncbi:hypothetical protein GCM10027184_39820 [Saccharothrix stipae]
MKTTTKLPLTPEEEFDARALKEGWANPGDFTVSDRKYHGPAGYVKYICAEFDGPAKTPNLTHGQRMEIEWKSEKGIFEAGVPLFCPQHMPLLQDAMNGTVKRNYGNGSYFVPDDIKPGTYKTMAAVRDCYWERTSPDGAIIDNNFVTAAKELTVTVYVSDGAFTSQNCGQWTLVG